MKKNFSVSCFMQGYELKTIFFINFSIDAFIFFSLAILPFCHQSFFNLTLRSLFQLKVNKLVLVRGEEQTPTLSLGYLQSFQINIPKMKDNNNI